MPNYLLLLSATFVPIPRYQLQVLFKHESYSPRPGYHRQDTLHFPDKYFQETLILFSLGFITRKLTK